MIRASDIDTIYVTGYGFPAWRGGPMFYADRVGLGLIYERIAAFQREFRRALDARAIARAPGARGRLVPGDSIAAEDGRRHAARS